MGVICSTDTETTQEAPAARLPPAREIAVPPGDGVNVPLQVFKVTTGVVICKPPGKASMKLSPERGTGALLVIVKTTATVLPIGVEPGLNCLLNIGAGTEITERLVGAL